MRRCLALAAFAFALTGCPGGSATTPPPPGEIAPVESGAVDSGTAPVGSATTPIGDVTQLVAIDAADGLTLPDDLAEKIKNARARIPYRIDEAQRAALEELESRYERMESQLDGMEEDGIPKDRPAYARLLASYYWDRLRLFEPSLDPDPPLEIFSAFARTNQQR